jgi:hypothetical protein
MTSPFFTSASSPQYQLWATFAKLIERLAAPIRELGCPSQEFPTFDRNRDQQTDDQFEQRSLFALILNVVASISKRSGSPKACKENGQSPWPFLLGSGALADRIH